jgi:hypothetical protein
VNSVCSKERNTSKVHPSLSCLFSGARRSSGAAAPKAREMSVKSSALDQTELAAPGDRRAPPNTCPLSSGQAHAGALVWNLVRARIAENDGSKS